VTVKRGSYANARLWDLQRDGVSWIPKGVVLEVLATELPQSPVLVGTFKAAVQAENNAWGCGELLAIRDYGADTVRFQVSQTALAATDEANILAGTGWLGLQNASFVKTSLINLYMSIYPAPSGYSSDQLEKYQSFWVGVTDSYYNMITSVVAPTDLPAFAAFLLILNQYYPIANYYGQPDNGQILSALGLQYDQLPTLNHYHGRIVSAVNMARSVGFTVILSMTNQEGGTFSDRTTTPTASTNDAWNVLARDFPNDQGVLLEMFNEPIYNFGTTWTSSSDSAVWHSWQGGDGQSIVSHQALVDAVRTKWAAKNVIIVDGVQGAAWVSVSNSDPLNSAGMPLNSLRDPLNSIVYAVHPYPAVNGNNNTLWRWQNNFGYFAVKQPVIATEWDSSSLISCRPMTQQSETPSADGTTTADSPLIAFDFLQFAASINLGVVAWAWDYPNQIVSSASYSGDDYHYALTSYQGFQCDPNGSSSTNINIYDGGPGTLLRDDWSASLQRP
jgi:hypothetical protein